MDGTPRRSGNPHAGSIRDAVTGRDLPNVQVTAFATSVTAMDLGCMFIDGALGTATSSGRGTFTLHISSRAISFAVRYCADGYVTRVDPANDNEAREPIRPEPVLLIRHDTDSKMMRRALVEIQSYVTARTAELIIINRYTFQQAAHDLPTSTRRLIGGMYIAGNNRMIPTGQWDRSVARRVWRLSADVLRNLDYLKRSAPQSFCEAAKSMSDFKELVRNDCDDTPQR